MSWLDVAMIGLVTGMVALLGAWTSGGSRRLAAGVLTGVGLWLALTAGLASAGVFAAWDARPPRFPLLPIAGLLAMLVVARTAALRALVAATPRSWPVAVQAFRVGVELLLFWLFASGRAPIQITFEGRNLDILVGLTAAPMAWWIRRGAGPAALVGWNLLGLGILANTVFTVVTSIPGPLHRPWPGEPLTVLATWPWVWLPAFLAPLAVAGHLVSLVQTVPLLRAARQSS
jgi:hypothetical protein